MRQGVDRFSAPSRFEPRLIEREMERAVSLARANRSMDAILAFHTVLLLSPQSALAHYNLGVLYEERGQTLGRP